MPTPDATDTDAYPAFASKAELITEIKQMAGPNMPNAFDLLRRLGNTDTSAFADPTERDSDAG